jgi:hypothetical protein
MLTGIEIGARIYEMRVLVPLWASAPPGTVRAYAAVRSAYASYVPYPDEQFWSITTPALLFVSLVVFFLGFVSTDKTRLLRIVASGLIFLLLLASYIFFTPTFARLNDRSVPYDEVTRLVQLWVSFNWGRIALLLAAWFVSIRVLAKTNPEEMT